MYSITDWIERKLGLKVNAEKTQYHKTGQAEISGLWVLQRPKGKGMEKQTARGIRGKIQTNIKETDKQKPEHGICGKGAEAEPGNQRVDKLLLR